MEVGQRRKWGSAICSGRPEDQRWDEGKVPGWEGLSRLG